MSDTSFYLQRVETVAGPIALDIAGVLTDTRGDVLTFGVLFALYFASSGVESLRIGLNRAYGVAEQRHWYWLRLESIAYVVVGAIGMLLCLVGVALASFSLALDFNMIEEGVRYGLPEKESWRMAFGLTATLVWLYVEILRFLAIFASNRD